MLQYLHVKNLALLEEVRLEFQGGFTTVTGETGAGKSILLGALSLLAGARAEKTMIRQGAEFCEIEALLDLRNRSHELDTLLRELDLPEPDEKGVLILKRFIYRDKPQKVQVNGGLATLNALQKLGKKWIDFHGPGEPQKLLQEKYQLKMLDMFAGLGGKLAAYQQKYFSWKALLKSAETLKQTEQLSEEEQYFYQNQIDEIDALQLSADRINELERDFKRIHCAKELSLESQKIQERLAGNRGVTDQLAEVVKSAETVAEFDPLVGDPLLERLNAVVIELEDIAQEYEKNAQGLDFDEEHAQRVQDDMSRWLILQRKYGCSVEQVLSKQASLKSKIQNQTNIEAQIETLMLQSVALEKELVEEAAVITQKRDVAGKDLAKQVQQRMLKLGFKHAQFEVLLQKTEALTEYGDTELIFLFGANVGQEPQPLSKIASSGETARVMLALKALLASVDATPLLVFDEVDANVGGEVGVNVGKELKQLAKGHQVLCITHLPQVAALGENHLIVVKEQQNGTTSVTIQDISKMLEKRVAELARMLGDSKTAITHLHARELLGASF